MSKNRQKGTVDTFLPFLCIFLRFLAKKLLKFSSFLLKMWQKMGEGRGESLQGTKNFEGGLDVVVEVGVKF